MKTLTAVFAIALIAAGCSGHKPVEAPEPAHRPKEFRFWLDEGKFVELTSGIARFGNMGIAVFSGDEWYASRLESEDRRQELEDRLNAWYETLENNLFDLKLIQEVGSMPRVDIGQPITPFLSEETIAAAGEEDYMQRIADDIYFAERELYMSLGQFRAHVAHYLGEKRLRLRPEEKKVGADQ
ncbi:MAG: hypothetical protein OXN17_18890 [Candidatus Poribacteria bacterium]|nr:hypothetical protein [Candidatus Poribacteria bacterium]MDE0503552.1 hypothetical protein [Candidatus Poribacteria bacterium]